MPKGRVGKRAGHGNCPIGPHRPLQEQEAPQDKAIAQLKQALEDDATDLWKVTSAIKKEIESRRWIIEGRGSYEWDDDRYRDETRLAFEAVLKLISNVQEPAANRFHRVLQNVHSLVSPVEAKDLTEPPIPDNPYPPYVTGYPDAERIDNELYVAWNEGAKAQREFYSAKQASTLDAVPALTEDKLREEIENLINKTNQINIPDDCGECCNFTDDRCVHEKATDNMAECPQVRLVSHTLALKLFSLIRARIAQAEQEGKKELADKIMKINKAGGNYYSYNGWVKTFEFQIPLDELKAWGIEEVKNE